MYNRLHCIHTDMAGENSPNTYHDLSLAETGPSSDYFWSLRHEGAVNPILGPDPNLQTQPVKKSIEFNFHFVVYFLFFVCSC